MRGTKNCAKCGTPFQMSPNDATVNCPDCRRTLRNAKPPEAPPIDYARREDERRALGYGDARAGRPSLVTANRSYREGYAEGLAAREQDSAPEESTSGTADKLDSLNERIGAKEARGDMRGMMGARGMYERAASLRREVEADKRATIALSITHHAYRVTFRTHTLGIISVPVGALGRSYTDKVIRRIARETFNLRTTRGLVFRKVEPNEIAATVGGFIVRAGASIKRASDEGAAIEREAIARVQANELVARLTGDRGVTIEESGAVVEWCRLWANDCYGQGTADEVSTETLLRRCHSMIESGAKLRGIEGGLTFVLSDVRRLAQGSSGVIRDGAVIECEPCDCGEVIGASGGYVQHASSDHAPLVIGPESASLIPRESEAFELGRADRVAGRPMLSRAAWCGAGGWYANTEAARWAHVYYVKGFESSR